ncbi:MAG: InlB B-repeat-containing protein, partial [Desulfobacterales bacterium]|nr:InlB B-repeat-containing protein [Desulfobacterales bacterium]
MKKYLCLLLFLLVPSIAGAVEAGYFDVSFWDNANFDTGTTVSAFTLSKSANPSAGGSITASPDKTSYTSGETVTLTAAPASSCYEFTGWSGDASGSTNPTTITMNGNKTVTATFKAKIYTITATAGSGGTISPSGSTIVQCGNNQTFTITANAGYQIADVKVNGSSVGAVSSYTFNNVTSNQSIAATFSQKTAGSGGTISPSGSLSVNHAGNQTYTITANTGYRITDVTVDGSSVGAVSTFTFSNVIANHTISATFSAGSYTITATAGSGGTISPSGSVSVTHGGNQTFSITPNSGYQITNVTVDGNSVGMVSTYTFSNV